MNARKRPNIIFIITDQQRFDTIAALGASYVDTPNLDRLVREGVTFSNCQITAPSCAPSRASLFTGYYPHTTGILKNADSWTRSWVEDLSGSGYRCVNVGKMHTYPYHTPLGFHERYVVENKDRYLEERYYFDEWDKALKHRGITKQQREIYRKLSDYRERLGAFTWDLPADTHPDNFVGDTACWWLCDYPTTEPLFLEIGFPGPHPPYDPTPEVLEKYLERDFSDSILEVTREELENQPDGFKILRQHNQDVDHDAVVLDLDPSPAQRHRQRAHYMANVEMIDAKVGEIMDQLEKKGYLENSIIIFTSDHGDCLTDHGHSQKWTMYDEVTRVPAIVWGPKYFQGGRTIEGMCQLFDFGATVIELAGLEVPRNFAAKSLLPALKGEPWEPREYAFAEHPSDGILTGVEYMTMVRSKDWKLVHFLGETCGQLFDLKADPREVNNLWDDPAHASKKQELLDAMRDWRMRSALQTKDWGVGHR